MSGYVILEIIICLAFIYLLYSLLATIVVEIIAGMFRLRARNLRFALRRMLQDGRDPDLGLYDKIVSYLFPRWYERSLMQAFFNHPHIKYLGKGKFYVTPSYLDPADFSQAMIEILSSQNGTSELQSIENALDYFPDFDKKQTYSPDEWNDFQQQLKSSPDQKAFIENWIRQFSEREQKELIEFDLAELNKLKIKLETAGESDKMKIVSDWKNQLRPELEIEPETRVQLSVLYKNAGGDLNKFRELLEGWFNSVMDRSKGWYKQWISKINFTVGLAIAVTFNLDTIQIFSELKTDTAKRDAILLQAENATAEDMEMLSDSLYHYTTSLNQTLAGVDSGTADADYSLGLQLFGWFLTALAISFGAPFWFDLLNKFMKLRTSVGVPKADPPALQEKKAARSAADIHPQAKG